MFLEWQVFFIERYINLRIALNSMDIKDWAAVISIGWILYQLIQRRRLTEANIDKYLERHFSDKSKSIQEQRQTYLAHFSTVASSWMVARIARACISSVARMVWFVWRFARFEFRRRSSAIHAMLLFDGGRTGPAHKEFL